eukprot:Hpha_TRINITY_DN15589_c1_g1::TRINITY_DN15589_c1_g1_i7::g.105009::m.105009
MKVEPTGEEPKYGLTLYCERESGERVAVDVPVDCTVADLEKAFEVRRGELRIGDQPLKNPEEMVCDTGVSMQSVLAEDGRWNLEELGRIVTTEYPDFSLEKPNADVRDKTLVCALVEDGRSEPLSTLLRRGGGSANERCGLHYELASPCHVAVRKGHSEALSVLIRDGGADVNLTDWDGFTPVCAAAELGQYDCLRILITEGHADVNKRTIANGYMTPCCIAAKKGHAECLRLLITEGKAIANKPTTCGTTNPMREAAWQGHHECLRILINEGKGEVNVATEYGDQSTPAWNAASNGHAESLRVLVREGNADVNFVRLGGEVPIHQVAMRGHYDCLRVLIEEGADVNKQLPGKYAPPGDAQVWGDTTFDVHHPSDSDSEGGWTPCHIATTYGQIACLRLLIDAGADVEKPRNDGRTPCHVAAALGQVGCLHTLIREGKADVHRVTSKGETACFLAARHSSHGCLMLLISDTQADLNRARGDGDTPCCIAAARNDSATLCILIEGRADVNKANFRTGFTPCYIAAKLGHLEALRVIVDDGQADLNKPSGGMTPLAVAESNGHSSCVSFLRTVGRRREDAPVAVEDAPVAKRKRGPATTFR